MQSITVKRQTKIAPEKMWHVIGDFANVAKFHPLLSGSELTGGQDNTVGGERVCSFKDGSSIREKLLEYEAGKHYRVEFIELGKFPFKRAFGTVGLTPTTNPGESEIYMTIDFQPKAGPMGWLMGKMMPAQLNKLLNQILASAESYARNNPVSA